MRGEPKKLHILDPAGLALCDSRRRPAEQGGILSADCKKCLQVAIATTKPEEYAPGVFAEAIARARELGVRLGMTALLLALCVLPAAAQFQGYFAQQIIRQRIIVPSVTATADFVVQNFGQASHSIGYVWTSGTFGPCSIEIQGSQDGTHFTTLAVGPGPPLGGSSYSSFAYGNGYYDTVRVEVDRENVNCSANGSLTVVYSGYQNPLPYNPTSQTIRITNVAGGGVASATINAPGTLYTLNDIVNITGGGGTGATFQITAVNGGGGATAGTLLTPGHGYATTVGAATAGGTGAGLTLNITAGVTTSTSAALPTEIASSPAILVGFQCTTSNAATFLQIYSSATAPTLGTGQIYEIALPAGTFQGQTSSAFVYGGPPIQGTAQFWFAAVTTLGGTTPVAAPVVCDAQINLRGPFITF